MMPTAEAAEAVRAVPVARLEVLEEVGQQAPMAEWKTNRETQIVVQHRCLVRGP